MRENPWWRKKHSLHNCLSSWGLSQNTQYSVSVRMRYLLPMWVRGVRVAVYHCCVCHTVYSCMSSWAAIVKLWRMEWIWSVSIVLNRLVGRCWTIQNNYRAVDRSLKSWTMRRVVFRMKRVVGNHGKDQLLVSERTCQEVMILWLVWRPSLILGAKMSLVRPYESLGWASVFCTCYCGWSMGSIVYFDSIRFDLIIFLAFSRVRPAMGCSL
jgi:hypothetical protein